MPGAGDGVESRPPGIGGRKQKIFNFYVDLELLI
jgi:hypothetical protein